MTNRFVFSGDGQSYNHDNPEDAILDVIRIASKLKQVTVGSELVYHKAIARDFVPADFFDVDCILDNANCRANDEGGEWAEDFGYCTPEQKDELETLIHAWANKNLSCTFYGIREDEKINFKVTESMFIEYS